jgi:hypothetical protein
MTLSKVKGDLQAAADAAAVAGAREIQVAKSDAKQVTSAAISHASYTLIGNPSATAQELQIEKLVVGASVVNNMSAVQVDIEEAWTPFFAHFLKADITPVKVSATARFVGSNNICVLGLSPKSSSVLLDKNARLTGNNCGVFADSGDGDALRANDAATLTTSINCAAGGTNISSSAAISPKALTSCPVVPDPLSSRPGPKVGSCDHTNLMYDTGSHTLDPGVYCGGIKITNTATAVFTPGTYILVDGDLELSGAASVSGDEVSFFLTGDVTGKLNFTLKSHVSFSAPSGGPMAGLLFFEDRARAVKLKHKISSDDARRLVGTIYLAVGDLVVDAKNPVADQSAWTAIITQHLELNGGPNLVLNSNYTATNVPVPEGIKGTSQVVLTE